MTALDRALESTVVDWNSIKRIVRKQKSICVLHTSLQKLVKVPRVPIDLIRFLLTRFEHGTGDHIVSEYDIMQCVHAIWHCILGNQSSRPLFIESEYDATSELLAITDGASLQANTVISDAFELTKLVVLALCQRTCPNANKTLSFLSAVMVLKLPPFLLWLAVAQDPDCLLSTQDNNGSLPLHEALRNVKILTRHPGCYFIRFPKEQRAGRAKHDAEHLKLLDLFNKKSAVQLLCHLSPQACRIALKSSASASSSLSHLIPSKNEENQDEVARLPLHGLLCSIHLEASPRSIPAHDGYSLSHQEFLDDVDAIISSAPLALETRDPEFRLYPFCLPQLKLCPTDALIFSTSQAENRECFLLSLAFDLLRSNPMVVARHLNRECSLEQTAYEKVLKERLQCERNKCKKLLQAQEVLKRDIEALRLKVAQYEPALSPPSKRPRS
jgi:hypothetical protein